LYATNLFDSDVRVVSTILVGPGLSESDSTGPIITLTNTGVLSLIAGTGTYVSNTTGNVTLWINPTLQTVTDAGNSTTNIVLFNSTVNSVSTTTGGVVISSGIGIGQDAWVGGTLHANNIDVTSLTDGTITAFNGIFTNVRVTATNYNSGTFANNALYVAGGIATPSGLTVGGDAVVYGNLYVQGTYTQITNQTAAIGRTVIALSTSTGPAIVDQGSGITVGPVANPYLTWLFDGINSWQSKGNINPTLDLTYSLGSSGLRWNHIYGGNLVLSSTVNSLNTNSGALIVAGGVGIGQDVVIGGKLKITSNAPSVSTLTGAMIIEGGLGIGGNLYGREIYSNGVLLRNGYASTFAGTDTAISTANNILSIWNTGTLQTVTQRGNSTDQAILITNETSSTGITTGSLVVAGGVGIGGKLYTGDDAYINNALAITTATIKLYSVTSLTAGTDTAVSKTTGDITIWGTSSLQSVTDRGASTNHAISITNLVNNSSTNTGQALLVAGGVGIAATMAAGKVITVDESAATTGGAGSLKVAGGAYIGKNLVINTTTNSTSTAGPNALYVAGGVGIVGNLNVDGTSVFNGPAVFNGTTTYVYSDNTVYTDNLIEIHVPAGGVPDVWNADDGKDIGFRFHYYNRSLSTDSNAALVFANDSQSLEFYDRGVESGDSSTFEGIRYGTFKTGAIKLTSVDQSLNTSSGALQVQGGIGVAAVSYFGGRFGTANTATISQQGIIVGSSGIGVTGDSRFEDSLAIGGDLWIEGTIHGAITDANSSLNIFVTSTTTASNLFIGFLGTDTGFSPEYASSLLRFNPSNGVTTFGGTVDSTTSTNGTIVVSGGAGIRKGLVVGGTLTNYGPLVILNTENATTTTDSGALRISGGAGINGSVYAYDIYDNGNRVLTSVNPIGGTAIGISSSTSNSGVASFTINNFGVTDAVGST
jgi:hypothetical protein